MGIEGSSLDREPQDLEVLKEYFRSYLEDAADMLEMDPGNPIPIEAFEAFDDIGEYPDLIMDSFREELGFDAANPVEVEEGSYVTQGAAGSAGEGKIQVTAYKTNRDGIYLVRYGYADGKDGWVLQSKDYVDPDRV